MYIRNCNSFCRNYLLHRKIFSNSLLLTTELIFTRIIPLLLSPCSKIFMQISRKLNVKKMLHLLFRLGDNSILNVLQKILPSFFSTKSWFIHGYYILTKLCHNWTSKNKKKLSLQTKILQVIVPLKWNSLPTAKFSSIM